MSEVEAVSWDWKEQPLDDEGGGPLGEALKALLFDFSKFACGSGECFCVSYFFGCFCHLIKNSYLNGHLMPVFFSKELIAFVNFDFCL